MAKNCTNCGKQLTFRDSFVFKGKPVCYVCLKKLESLPADSIPSQFRDQKQESFSVPKDKATVLQQQKNLGIILTVLGGVIGIWVFTRFTSVIGQMATWSPPFSDYETFTLLGAAAAAILVIVGLINLTKKQ
ncbi:MAG: hypothetical protein QW838_07200 [Candidatus Nitrosotenuis sp.]